MGMSPSPVSVSVITTVASRTVVPQSRSVGAAAAAAGGRLQSIRRTARLRGGTVIGGHFGVAVGSAGGRMVAEGALVRSVHQYRRSLRPPQRAPGRRLDVRA